MDENKNVLTDAEIDDIAKAASEADNGTMADLKETVEVNPDAELEQGEAEINSETNEIEAIAKTVDRDLKIDLFDAADPETISKAAEEKMLSNIQTGMDLDENEAFDFIKVINDIRAGRIIPNLYNVLPKKIQDTINKLMLESKIPVQHRNEVSKLILNEFINSAEVEAAFVDFEKALNETLQIPSMVDMYGEHTREVMEKNIPEMIEKIKDEEPEKAAMLEKVKEGYTKSYTLELVKAAYESSSSMRKTVRRSDIDFRRCLDDFNKKNSTTRFKMYDVYEVPNALAKVLCADPVTQYARCIEGGTEIPESVQKLVDFKTSEDDIKKFCVLLTSSCEELNAEDVIDASYMYYLTKNIIMLRHTADGKTGFAAELINNICDVIALIRNKEAEFYAENPHLVKSKLSKKSRSSRGGKK